MDVLHQRVLLVHDDALEQGPHGFELWRAPIRFAEAVEQLDPAEVVGNMSLHDLETIGFVPQRNREDGVRAVDQQTIAVDPSLLRVLDVVVEDNRSTAWISWK
ncbi:MAG: hypothetical protein WDN30_15035 [Pararobbsia sp.]